MKFFLCMLSLLLVSIHSTVLAQRITPLTGSHFRYKSANKPNILLLIVDDWGKDKSSLYTQFNPDEISIPTPTINKIAEHGVLFNNAWASPNCSPTRATLVTGQYPIRNGVRDVIESENAVGIDTTDPYLLPHRLKRAGYVNGMVGKWHLTSDSDNVDNKAPLEAGFDFWTGTNGSFGPDSDNLPIDYTAYYVTPQIQCDYTLDPAFCAPDPDWKTTLEYDNATDLTETLRSQYESIYEVNQAIDWINRQDSNKPWFMYLAFQAPHAPFVLPPKHLLSEQLLLQVQQTIAELTDNPDYVYTEGQRLLSFEITESAQSPDQEPKTQRLPNTALARAAYAAMVAAVDHEIGRLFDHIDLSNTVVILLGDNGTSGSVIDEDLPGFPEHNADLRGKGTLFQGGISVPMMIYAPEIKKPGRTANTLVHSSDIYATILDIVGIPYKKRKRRVDGVSFQSGFKPGYPGVLRRRFVWSDYGPNPPSNIKLNHNDSPWGYTVRDYRYKLKSNALFDEQGNVLCKTDVTGDEICATRDWQTEVSMYDLQRDPTEQHDLLGQDVDALSFWPRLRYWFLRYYQTRVFHSIK